MGGGGGEGGEVGENAGEEGEGGDGIGWGLWTCHVGSYRLDESHHERVLRDSTYLSAPASPYPELCLQHLYKTSQTTYSNSSLPNQPISTDNPHPVASVFQARALTRNRRHT